MEKLVIRVDSNAKIGTGHLVRCLALGQAWKDAGRQVVFIVACQNEGLLRQMYEEKFDIHLLRKCYPDDSESDSTMSVLAAHPNAWVVLDGYHFDEAYQRRVGKAGHRLLIIDDMAQLKHYYADILLNQNLGAEQLNYPCEPYTCLLLGTQYSLLRRDFLAWKSWKRKIPKVARRILVTFGGSDPENYTIQAIQALQKIDILGLEAIVVVGASNTHIDELKAAAKQSRVPIRLAHNVKDMAKLMAWADVAVALAGSTVWELIFMSVPALIVAVVDNQIPIAKSTMAADVAIWINHRSQDYIEILAEELRRLVVDFKRRSDLSLRQRSLIDGLGKERVVQAADKYMHKVELEP